MAPFVDRVEIEAQGGSGGHGCVSFHREKFVPRGGPDGGNGGSGGDVVLVGSRRLHTLLDHRYRKNYLADRGRNGGSSDKTGRGGVDLEVCIPLGTEIRDAASGELLGDLVQDGQRLIVAHGGRGGRGNASFASSTNRAPRKAEDGQPGGHCRLVLELKLLADVGLVGLPNAGKSTLLSRITPARPKIGAYPFTTLDPNLGVVKLADLRSFVVADIPGIIQGAHEGAGLGLRFLRHIERTRLLLLLVDVSPEATTEPLQAAQILRRELTEYDPRLKDRPFLVAATKIDLTGAEDSLPELQAELGVPVIAISAVTGIGLKELVGAVNAALDRLQSEDPEE